LTLLHASAIGLAFGSRTILDELTLTIEEGERVGLVGVNGSGKSSLLRILARVAEPDRGEVQLRRGASVTYLPQEPEFPEGATVASELEVARAPLKAAIDAHAALSERIGAEGDPERHDRMLAELAVLSDRVEHLGGWDTAHEARRLLDRLGVPDWDRAVAELSGGARKRVAIARALLARPDLLLLDEPTNHLDADTVDWLEDELDGRSGALVLVTHDRYFLDDLVDRIVEITPTGGVTSWPGNYEAFLEQKLVLEEQSALGQHKRERWISQEVAWLRRGPEARRTKSKARIQRARALMARRASRARASPSFKWPRRRASPRS
jgi:ATP-binding cassette subfamily F protein uup